MPGISRNRRIAALTAAALAGSAGAAQAAPTIIAPSCVHAGESLTIGLRGFTPNTDVQVKSLENGYYDETLTTDANGAAEKTVPVGYGSLVSYPYVFPGVWTLQATDAAGVTASLPTHVAMWMFDYSGGRSLKAKRTWRFSGWVPGKPLYAHYRHEGRTYGNRRFGVPTGPCGYLKTKAPLLPVKVKHAGRWTVWVDQSKTYKNENPRALSSSFDVVRRSS
jgi:hypothetical protein